MKNMKSLMLVGLLIIGSVVSANDSSAKDFKQAMDQLQKDYKKFIDERNERRKNSTPLEKAAIAADDLLMNTAWVATGVGVCSYAVDAILSSFDATKEIPHRGTVATGSCAALYASLYASFKNEEMQKSKDKQKSFYDWLAGR